MKLSIFSSRANRLYQESRMKQLFYLLCSKEWRRCPKCQMGSGHCLPGVRACIEDREIYSQFLKTLLNIFSPYFTGPKTPLWSPSQSKENQHLRVLSVSSQTLLYTRHIQHYSYIPNVHPSTSQLHTSLSSHLSQQTSFWE